MVRLPIKCSEPMLLAKREAPTGIQCIFLELDFKMNLNLLLRKCVTSMQEKSRQHYHDYFFGLPVAQSPFKVNLSSHWSCSTMFESFYYCLD